VEIKLIFFFTYPSPLPKWNFYSNNARIHDVDSIIKFIFVSLVARLFSNSHSPTATGQRRFNPFSTIVPNHWIPLDESERRPVCATKLNDASRIAFRPRLADSPIFYWRCIWTAGLRKFGQARRPLETQFTQFTLDDHSGWIIPSTYTYCTNEFSLRCGIVNPVAFT